VGNKIREHAEALAQLEALSAGKPIRDCRGEVGKVAEMFEYYGGWADKFYGDVIPVPSTHLNYTRREPVGTVLQVTPWNAPLFTCGWQVAPAIAMGNAVLLKPSELTPFTSLALASLAEQAGVPVGLINVLAGYGHTVGQAPLITRRSRKWCSSVRRKPARKLPKPQPNAYCLAYWNWVASRPTSCLKMPI